MESLSDGRFQAVSIVVGTEGRERGEEADREVDKQTRLRDYEETGIRGSLLLLGCGAVDLSKGDEMGWITLI